MRNAYLFHTGERMRILQKYNLLPRSAVQALLTGIFLFCFSILCAQGQKPGTLTGKVMDAGNNEPLSRTSILVKNSKVGVNSITDGTYVVTLAPGTYTIVYSMSGYQTKEITDVIIKSDETTFLDILMTVASQQLNDVVITAPAKKETQSAVYSLQKRSAAASDGISSQSISQTPDNNGGQILKRVTGVNIVDNKFVVVRGLADQYNQTVLNGVPMTSTESNKNAFAFDLIPAAAIDNIVVNKTATPDLPGSFAGGIVQINTKDFPSKDFLTLTAQVGLSDKTYGKPFYSDERSKFQVLGFDGGIRDLPKGFPTNTSRVSLTNLHYTEQVRYLRQLPNNLVPINQGNSNLNQQVQIGLGKNINFKNGTQFGFIASLNQRKTQLIEQDINMRNPKIGEEFFLFPQIRTFFTDPNNQDDLIAVVRDYSENVRYKYAVDLGGVFNLAYRFGNNKLSLKNLFTQGYNNQFVDRQYIYKEGFRFPDQVRDYGQYGFVYTSSTRRIINSTLSGEHRTGAAKETRIDWNITSTLNSSKQPDTRNFVFGSDSTKNFVGIDNSVRVVRDFLNQSSRTWNNLRDFIYSGGFNVTTPFTLFKEKQLFKAGIFFQNRTRQNRATIIPYDNMEGTVNSVLSPEDIIDRRTTISQGVAALAEEGGDYNAGSSLIAMYESVENKIGEKIRIIWGIRMEKYQQNSNVFKTTYYNGFQQLEPIVSRFASRADFNFLPSVNFIFSPSSSSNLRLAYSNTVIRPDLKDIVGIPSFDVVNFRLTFGNPELRSARIKNYDLKYEWFPSAGEIISVAGFYKSMIDPIEYVVPENQLLYPDVGGVPVNTGKAYVRGIEIEIRKKIDFIPAVPWLKNLTMFGNASFLQSKVAEQFVESTVATRILEHSLTGQSNYLVNAGINIAAFKNSFELTVSYNRTGDYIGELGWLVNDPIANSYLYTPPIPDDYTRQNIPNYYVKARHQLDLVISKSFYKNKAKIKLNVSNLLSEPFILYQDLNNNKKFDAPLTIQLGPNKNNAAPVRLNQAKYKSGVDNTASSVTGQKTFSLSFSYTF